MKAKAVVEDYGAAAGFQSNLAGTVFTTATYTHEVLEKAEYGLGLLSGGTYTVASLTTKAGLAAVVKTVARNYLTAEIAQAALTPVMTDAMNLAQRANLNVNPTYLRAGLLAMQATGVVAPALKKLKPFVAEPANRSVPLLTKHPNVARAELRAAMGEARGSGLNAAEEAHHLIARDALKDPDVATLMVRAGRGGFSMNGPTNGAILPKGHGIGQNTAKHAEYTAEAVDRLRQKIREAGGLGKIDDAEAKRIAESVADTMRLRVDDFWSPS